MSSTTPHLASETDAERIAKEAKRKDEEARKLRAECEKVRDLTLRVKRLEKTIRIFLTSKKLTEEQRDELVSLLAGLRAPGHNPKYVLSPGEERLIEAYRAMGDMGRSSIRWFFEQLAGDASKQGRSDRGE